MKIPIRPVYRKKLEDGPTLLVKERHDHPVVAINFWVRTGSVNEEPVLSGISHFFEHMFFKGTEKYPQGEMDRQVKAMGGYNNAATSYEFTNYYIVVPKWHFVRAVDLLVDGLLNPIIRPEDVETERPILGRQESLDNIGKTELNDYYHTHYRPGSLVAVIVGDVKANFAEETLGEALETEKRTDTGKEEPGKFEVPRLARKRDRFEDKDINQIYAAIGYHTPGMRNRELLPAFEVAATILGGGKSSRLYKRLLEQEQLVSSISAWHMELRWAGVFGIDTVFRPGREGDVNRCIFEEIQRLSKRGPSADELHRAKVMLETGFLYENETNASLSGTLGYYEVCYGTADAAVDYMEAIEGVDAKDVDTVLRDFVVEQPFSRVVIGPGGTAG
jgi:zinc protease